MYKFHLAQVALDALQSIGEPATGVTFHLHSTQWIDGTLHVQALDANYRVCVATIAMSYLDHSGVTVVAKFAIFVNTSQN